MRLIMGTPSERDLLWKRRIAEIDRRSLESAIRAEGRAEGKLEERKELNAFYTMLLEQGRIEDLKRCIADPEYLNQLLKELF